MPIWCKLLTYPKVVPAQVRDRMAYIVQLMPMQVIISLRPEPAIFYPLSIVQLPVVSDSRYSEGKTSTPSAVIAVQHDIRSRN